MSSEKRNWKALAETSALRDLLSGRSWMDGLADLREGMAVGGVECRGDGRWSLEDAAERTENREDIGLAG